MKQIINYKRLVLNILPEHDKLIEWGGFIALLEPTCIAFIWSAQPYIMWHIIAGTKIILHYPGP
jgi:hypothetical protein